MSRRKTADSGPGEWHGDLGHDLPMEKQHTAFKAAHELDSKVGNFFVGQRWSSTTEPELGIAVITAIEGKRISLSFQDGACVRQYALHGAPLQRVVFHPGDTIRIKTDAKVTIEEVLEEHGVLVYKTSDGDRVPESEVSCVEGGRSPMAHLIAGQFNTCKDFTLRRKVLDWQNRLAGSPVRGFIGGRIQLLPHQLYIAKNVVSMHRRRVLLADEVGLGKTIEACCILHRLLLTGLAQRVLILAPESMVHVWFVELIRKFNITFRIGDKDYFPKETVISQNQNHFLAEQLFICDIDYCAEHANLVDQAVHAEWDLVIVDEIHRICPETKRFALIKGLTQNTRDVLFLSATPQQNGERSHFARLQLLDPSRYPDYDHYTAEAALHGSVAEITGHILDEKPLTTDEAENLRHFFPGCDDLVSDLMCGNKKTPYHIKRQFVTQLLDRYGVGRAMYRNTRSVIGGFPDRTVSIVLLETSASMVEQVVAEFDNDTKERNSDKYNYAEDPRLRFLVELLHAVKPDKVLCICHSKEKVRAVIKALKAKTKMAVAEFHEELSLIQRDRQAAWFSEEDGARMLVCSEIGSEGRNFQFAHHLVLWDLPMSPELIEQRIGRLDRIGQKHSITIHVPVIAQSPYAMLARLFHNGFGIFSNAVSGASEVFEKIFPELSSILELQFHSGGNIGNAFEQLLLRTQQLMKTVGEELEAGRDRLLEQHSYNPVEAMGIVDSILKAENNPEFERFVLDLFSAFGIIIEEVGPHTCKLWTSELPDESFPGLSPSRPMITFSRETAVHREDFEFITPDHPSVREAIDLFLGSERGSCSCALWDAGPESRLLLEVVFVIECIAPPDLHVDRFLPRTPVSCIVDHCMRDCTDLLSSFDFQAILKECSTLPVLDKSEVKQKLLPEMMQKAEGLAALKSSVIIKQALEKVRQTLSGEIERVKVLHEVNNSINLEDIDIIKDEMLSLISVIEKAVPRCDSIRVIWKTAGKK